MLANSQRCGYMALLVIGALKFGDKYHRMLLVVDIASQARLTILRVLQ